MAQSRSRGPIARGKVAQAGTRPHSPPQNATVQGKVVQTCARSYSPTCHPMVQGRILQSYNPVQHGPIVRGVVPQSGARSCRPGHGLAVQGNVSQFRARSCSPGRSSPVQRTVIQFRARTCSPGPWRALTVQGAVIQNVARACTPPGRSVARSHSPVQVAVPRCRAHSPSPGQFVSRSPVRSPGQGPAVQVTVLQAQANYPNPGHLPQVRSTCPQSAVQRPSPVHIAQAPQTILPVAVPAWKVDYSYPLGSTIGKNERAYLLNEATFSSVRQTVDALNQSSNIAQFATFAAPAVSMNLCSLGFCVVHSISKKVYFLLWREDKRNEAFSTLAACGRVFENAPLPWASPSAQPAKSPAIKPFANAQPAKSSTDKPAAAKEVGQEGLKSQVHGEVQIIDEQEDWEQLIDVTVVLKNPVKAQARAKEVVANSNINTHEELDEQSPETIPLLQSSSESFVIKDERPLEAQRIGPDGGHATQGKRMTLSPNQQKTLSTDTPMTTSPPNSPQTPKVLVTPQRSTPKQQGTCSTDSHETRKDMPTTAPRPPGIAMAQGLLRPPSLLPPPPVSLFRPRHVKAGETSNFEEGWVQSANEWAAAAAASTRRVRRAGKATEWTAHKLQAKATAQALLPNQECKQARLDWAKLEGVGAACEEAAAAWQAATKLMITAATCERAERWTSVGRSTTADLMTNEVAAMLATAAAARATAEAAIAAESTEVASAWTAAASAWEAAATELMEEEATTVSAEEALCEAL